MKVVTIIIKDKIGTILSSKSLYDSSLEIMRNNDNELTVIIKSDEFLITEWRTDVLSSTYTELPNDESIKKHIDYLISCRQNLIDNADNMPQHLLEGGCMAFESAIDNARELFYGGNNEQQ